MRTITLGKPTKVSVSGLMRGELWQPGPLVQNTFTHAMDASDPAWESIDSPGAAAPQDLIDYLSDPAQGRDYQWAQPVNAHLKLSWDVDHYHIEIRISIPKTMPGLEKVWFTKPKREGIRVIRRRA